MLWQHDLLRHQPEDSNGNDLPGPMRVTVIRELRSVNAVVILQTSNKSKTPRTARGFLWKMLLLDSFIKALFIRLHRKF